jgi:hypothetical protein
VRLSLSHIREHYQYVEERYFDTLSRREMVEMAVARAMVEAREAERAEAEYREGVYDDRPGDAVDDYEGEMPW